MTEPAEPIAIIGLGARVPGAVDVAQYWSNLREGRESISFLSDAELLENGVSPVALADPDYVKALPTAPEIKLFDAELFGMTAREAEVCDPALRLFLEVAHAAIEDAGYDVTAVGEGFGVFSASGPCDYRNHNVRQSLKYRSASDFQIASLNNTDYSATLAAYKLNLRGPAMTIVTACSSSLVALHVAAQALRQSECDAAVVGGAYVETPYGQGHRWVPGAVRSQDGHCRPFDAAATGTMFGDGSAAVVVKRLSDARRDGDNIRAVLLGSAVNNDGSDKVSFSAPSGPGQTAVIVEAMTRAGCHPREISYVEAHGTATALGDPMEVAALTTAYRRLAGRDLPRGSIGLGSVKSNIGHLVWAAGISEVIKVALALEHEEIPPTVNFTEPNPRLELDGTPLTIVDRLRPWPRVEGAPRRAGVSSLGIGGTNAHAVLGEAPPVPDRPAVPERPRLVVWSGLSRDAVEDGRRRLAGYFQGPEFAAGADAAAQSFADATATLQRGRQVHRMRAAAVGRNAAEAAAALTAGRFAAAGESVPADARPLAFMFPGQGSQHAAMATGLYDAVPYFAAAVDRCLDGFAGHGLDLRAAWRSADPAALTDTTSAQPLLFAVEYALAETLRHWGLEPAALLGHSIGELTAAAVAGVFSLDDGIRLVAARARAMGAAPRGAMVSVLAAADEVAALLPDPLVVSVRNSRRQAIVGGPAADVEALERDFAARGLSTRRLATSHAFHTPMMADAAREFLEVMRTVELHPPRIPVVSAATGRRLTGDQAVDPAFWADQVTAPVRFDLALETMLATPWTLLEAGPGQVLTGLARRQRGLADTALPTLGAADGAAADAERVLEAVGRLWVAGHAVDWAHLAGDPGGGFRRRAVPGYPYQRKLHWVTPSTGPAAPRRADETDVIVPGAATAVPAPVSGAPGAGSAETEPPTPFTAVTWIEAPARPARPDGPGPATALAFLPADREQALGVLGPLLRTGAMTIRVLPGTEFSASGHEFRVRPGVPADVKEVFARLAAEGRRPDLLVHAWGVPPWDAPHSATVDGQLDLAFTSLLALVQHGTSRPVDGRLPRLLVLTGRAADVSGAEPLDPVKAAVHGLTRTLAQEAPAVACTVIDIGPGTTEQALAAEIARTDGPEFVALRGHRRWVPRERPLDPDGEAVALRQGGVYVVTGGLGGLGPAVGLALARTGSRPRLVLAGRRALPEDAAAAAGRDAGLRRILAAVDEMTGLGAEVRTVACDVADPAQVARMLDFAAAEFGPVTGVLHLAGVAGGGMLHLRAPADALAVLRPKVRGTLVLQEALRGRPEMDFFVSFSSRAAVHGLVGSGDYAAANAVLDALATAGDGRHRRLSIGWPAWSGAGMAAEGSRRLGGGQSAGTDSAAEPGREPLEVEATLDPAVDWVLDEHRLDGRPVLPGTGHLNLVVSAFRGLGLISEDDAVLLADTCFHSAVVADTALAVRMRFTPDRDRWRFELASRAAGAGDGAEAAWAAHSSGWISGCARKDVMIPPEALREGFAEVEPPSLRPSPGRLFALGGRWQNIDRMWRDDAKRERTVRLELPAEFAADVERCPVHPALLDGATATVRDDSDDVHLPFMYRRAVFHRALPPVLFSHMKRSPDKPGVITADITMVAPDGMLVAEVEGFVMRRTGRQLHFLAQDAEVDAPANASAATALAAADLLPTAADGLDLDEGGRLLTRLLQTATPSHVLVRPHVDGRPTPIVERAVALPSQPVAAAPAAPAASAAPAAPATGTAPSDTTLAAVLDMWREALGADDLGPDDEFFELGGDSLSAVQLMGRIRERFGVELSIAVLFECPTARELADELARTAKTG